MAMPLSDLWGSLPRPRPPRVRRVPLACALAVCAALSCGDDPNAPRRIDATDAEVIAASDAATDAADRIAAQLDAASGGAVLRTRLGELAARILVRDLDGATASLQLSRAALDVAEGAGPTDQAPDRAAIRLVLDGAQRLLDESD
jgi:hypothetical protein